jgi:hypothetical protein
MWHSWHNRKENELINILASYRWQFYTNQWQNDEETSCS